MAITGELKSRIQEALLNAFPTHGALSAFSETKLNTFLGHITNLNSKLPDVALDLIRWADSGTGVAELLDKACAASPNPMLAACREAAAREIASQAARGPRAADAAEPASQQVQTVRDALDVLRDLMKDSKVRNMVYAFRNKFETARDQIALLGDYKQLHDVLHEIQMQLYGEIDEAVGRFSTDPADARGDLEFYRTRLNGYVTQTRDVAAKASAAEPEANLLHDELKGASEQLHVAAGVSDDKSLKAGLRNLSLILSQRPQVIDAKLHSTSSTLPLKQLAAALGVVCVEIERLHGDNEKAATFRHGVDALTRLDGVLRAMIDAHHKWQWVDNQLRAVEFRLEDDIGELDKSWPRLRPQAEQLAQANPDGWGADFLTFTAKLDGDLISKELAKIKKSFGKCRRLAGDRFFDVDKKLLTTCGELRSTCEPLNSILEML